MPKHPLLMSVLGGALSLLLLGSLLLLFRRKRFRRVRIVHGPSRCDLPKSPPSRSGRIQIRRTPSTGPRSPPDDARRRREAAILEATDPCYLTPNSLKLGAATVDTCVGIDIELDDADVSTSTAHSNSVSESSRHTSSLYTNSEAADEVGTAEVADTARCSAVETDSAASIPAYEPAVAVPSSPNPHDSGMDSGQRESSRSSPSRSTGSESDTESETC